MSDREQVEREIREFLEKADNLTRDDKIKYLRALFEKHFEFQKLDHLVNYYDFHYIVSCAKSNYLQIKTPALISRKHLSPHETAHVAMIQAVVGYLNQKGLLRKLIKFDFTEDR